MYLHRYTAVSLMLVCIYSDASSDIGASVYLHRCSSSDSDASVYLHRYMAMALMQVCSYTGTQQCHRC